MDSISEFIYAISGAIGAFVASLFKQIRRPPPPRKLLVIVLIVK